MFDQVTTSSTTSWMTMNKKKEPNRNIKGHDHADLETHFFLTKCLLMCTIKDINALSDDQFRHFLVIGMATQGNCYTTISFIALWMCYLSTAWR